MVAHVNTVAFRGIDVVDVDVQVQMSSGLPAFTIVGLPDKAVAESRERVRAALSAVGLSLPPKRITVNLAPASLAKEGSYYDLPIALGLLVDMDVVAADDLGDYCALGELGLDGTIAPVAGVLLAAINAAAGHRGLICPAASGGEAPWAGAIDILAAPDILSLINHLKGTQLLPQPQPTMSEAGYEQLIGQNRGRYCERFDETRTLSEAPLQPMSPDLSPINVDPLHQATHSSSAESEKMIPISPVPPSSSEPVARDVVRRETERKHDRQHVYLQNLIRQLAQDRDFLATIETPVLNGAGRVDVSLVRNELKIAAEVTVTTSPEHELGNVLKCLSAGYDWVLVVSSSKKHLDAVEKHVVPNFLQPEAFAAHLDKLQISDGTEEKVIRGYRVRVSRRPVSGADAKARKDAINKVIA